MPDKRKYRTWILDHILITEGYSLSDIEEMEDDEYDFRVLLVLEMKKSGKTNKGVGI